VEFLDTGAVLSLASLVPLAGGNSCCACSRSGGLCLFNAGAVQVSLILGCCVASFTAAAAAVVDECAESAGTWGMGVESSPLKEMRRRLWLEV
jgi:hypothetical protein